LIGANNNEFHDVFLTTEIKILVRAERYHAPLAIFPFFQYRC